MRNKWSMKKRSLELFGEVIIGTFTCNRDINIFYMIASKNCKLNKEWKNKIFNLKMPNSNFYQTK